MSFISYAQNFEDVMLWRALHHIENGTYVDVGAQDPVVDSVSKGFYEHGWRGVHIEPVPFYAERLRHDRPGETVLQAALGETSGTLALTVIPGTGLSTAVDEHSRRHHEAGFETVEVHVPMLTLASALGMLAGRAVHWLKIDVEGFEEAVLKGWDSRALRPWIMVIEATIPGSSETDYERWDPIVAEAGYRFVYFDGLNRFYVADEHPELVGAFNAPPNVFDSFELSGQSSWGLYHRVEAQQREMLMQARDQVQVLGDQLVEQRTTLVEQEAALAKQEAALAGQGVALTQQAATLAEQAETLAGQVLMLAESKETLTQNEARLAERDAAAKRLAAEAAQAAVIAAQVQPLRQENEKARRRMAEMQMEIHDWWSVADGLNAEVQALRKKTQMEIHHWWSVADGLNRRVQAVHASMSWRVMAPLRSLRALASGLPGAAPWAARWIVQRARRVGRPLLLWTVRNMLEHPGLRAWALRLLAHQPKLKGYLRRFAGRAGLVALPAQFGMPEETAAMTEVPFSPSLTAPEIVPLANMGTRADRIYGQLKRHSSWGKQCAS